MVAGLRLSAVARAVIGQHELAGEPFPQRVPVDQRGQLQHQLVVPAEFQVRRHPLL